MTPEEAAAALVADWPPLSDDQLARIAVLLRGSADVEQDGPRVEPLGEAS